MNTARLSGVLVAMVTLAALDLLGALCAKEYAERQRPLAVVLGLISFAVLFGVYIAALKYAELSIVTMGWIVMLQIALLAVDQRLYGLELDLRQWIAVAAILALQCYLIVSTSTSAEDAADAATDTASVVTPESMAAATTHPIPTPYLVIDLDVVAQRYAELGAALPGIALHYAVKANPAPEVLERLVREGASFDVASPAEIVACLAAGADPAHLSYGNTAKKERDIAAAFAQGVRLFTFDDPTELAKLGRAAPEATLLCRLTTSGIGADWSLSEKFGCSPRQTTTLLLAAARSGHPVGIAFHVGSQQRDPLQWDAPLAAVGQIQAALAANGVPLAVVDIGGGFPGSYRVAAPAIEEYGRAIAAAVRRHLRDPMPRVIAEPGRFLVADAGVIESEVVLVAQRGPERWVHLDIGIFGGLAEALDEAIQYRIDTDRDAEPTGPVVIAGPTCDSVDVLYRRAGYRLPLALQAGDRVRLLATGAYTASYSSVGFNGLPPLASYAVSGRSQHQLPVLA